MEYFLGLEDQCPKILASTHFHGMFYVNDLGLQIELFENGFLDPRPRLGFAHMEVCVDPEASEVESQLVYLYTVQEGRSISTFGTWSV
jgi:DNA mismatch repair protein MSH5